MHIEYIDGRRFLCAGTASPADLRFNIQSLAGIACCAPTLEDAALALGLANQPFRQKFHGGTLRFWITPSGREFRGSRREFLGWAALPYGRWDCDGGRVVLFNRFYEPIWERTAASEVRRADPAEWVKWRAQSWFYGNAEAPSSPWRDRETERRCLRILTDFGVVL
jgi:hypothetical protein